MVEEKERVVAEDRFYSPRRVRYWLEHWRDLQELAVPTAGAIRYDHIAFGGAPLDPTRTTEILVDLERAYIHLHPWSLEHQVAEWSMRGTPEQQWLDDKVEAAFQADVLEAAGYLGYLRYHSHDSRRDNERAGVDPGFLDCTLVHPEMERLVFAELKTETGRIRPGQRRWADALRRVKTIEVHEAWRPHDMDDIIRILQGK